MSHRRRGPRERLQIRREMRGSGSRACRFTVPLSIQFAYFCLFFYYPILRLSRCNFNSLLRNVSHADAMAFVHGEENYCANAILQSYQMLIFVSKFFDCKSDKIIVTAINVFLKYGFLSCFHIHIIFLEQHILRLTHRNVLYRLFQFPFEKYCFLSPNLLKNCASQSANFHVDHICYRCLLLLLGYYIS